MSGNSFGSLFTVTSFGESHGPAIGGIIEGCPSGFELDINAIQKQLELRKPGQSAFTSQRKESDQIEIFSGIYEGKTTGTPIGFIIKNQDAKKKDYEAIKDAFRPSHADYTYYKKYGHYNPYGGGRASARETAIRVAAGAVAAQYLKAQCNIEIEAYLSQIGTRKLDFSSIEETYNNPFFCANAKQVNAIKQDLLALRKEQDSIGGKVTVMAHHVPAGLGEPVFDKCDAKIAYALMGIGGVKAVEIGDGFEVVAQKGSNHRDHLSKEQGFLSNHSGGMLGGISNGETIIAHASFKPTSSIAQSVNTLDIYGENTTIKVTGRHDPCIAIRGVCVVKAMMALVLMDLYLLQKAKCD